MCGVKLINGKVFKSPKVRSFK